MNVIGDSIGSLVNKLGLGFGGISPEHCRLWIDSDMKHGSYVRSDNDNTYINGPLGDSSINGRIEIEELEIWTFGNQADNSFLNKKLAEYFLLF